MGRSIFIASNAGQELTGLSKGFENYGYNVVINNGEDVLDELSKGKAPSVIILDSLLKDVSTLEICRQVKEQKRYERTPVLILKDKNFDSKQFLDLGVKDFIERPVSLSRIHEAIESLIPEKKRSYLDSLSYEKKVKGTVIILLVFLGLLTYFVIIPMIRGNPPKKGKIKEGYEKSSFMAKATFLEQNPLVT